MFARTSMMLWISLGIIAVGLGGIAAYFFLFHRANPPLRKNQVRVGAATFSVEIASTTVAEARGLSFRPSLDQGSGMLFIFGARGIKNFWMKDMNFPIDIVWIGGDIVLGFVENAPPPAKGTPPWSLPVYSSPDGTDKVLEVNAHAVRDHGIKVGDAVRFDI